MDQLKKLGALCRQHYEKIILVVVMLLMAVAAYLMIKQSQEKRREVQGKPVGFETKKVKGVKPINLAAIEAAITAAATPPPVSLGGQHNLFNPVRWIQYPNERKKIETGREIGASQMEILAIRPLVLSISYERTLTSGTGDQRIVTGYQTLATNDLATTTARRRVPQYISVGETNKLLFVLTGVEGPADAPTKLNARLKDYGGEAVSFAPGAPYVRIVGYEVDLKYKLNSSTFMNKRKDATFTIEGDTYNIVDITENSVVVSDQSNGKRETIRQTTPPP